MSSTLIQASRPLARARSQSNTMRPFSIAIPARLANEGTHMTKLRGFLAEKDTTPRQESPYGKRMEFDSFRRVQQQMSEYGQRLDQLEKTIQQLTRMQGVY
ncbi:hypothetical protein BDV32DRAFT_127543 [Aspergillus pseudonomiae]|nr:hypothetical protein BDV32DRAFT_127543 [Aspergillus pseudonomiae]